MSLLLQRQPSMRSGQISSDVLLTNEHPIDQFLHAKTLLTAGINKECKYQIVNPNANTRARFPTINCGKRTQYGCSDCIYGNSRRKHFCKLHLIAHAEHLRQ